MIKHVITLVYAMAVLIIMIYPAMRTIEQLGKRNSFINKHYNLLTVITTIVLSLIAGLFLSYF